MMARSAVTWVFAFLLAAGLAGCRTVECEQCASGAEKADTNVKSQAGKKEDDQKKEMEFKRRALERKMNVAEARLKHAQLDYDMNERTQEATIAHAKKDYEIAMAKSKQFEKFDAPTRIARKKLALQNAMDAAQEADEELKQLEIMYKEQDLEDKTREFVINRGKRNAERRRKSLEIAKEELKALTEYEIQRERDSIDLEVSKKANALEKAERDAEAGRLQKKIALMSIEKEIEDLKDEMARIEEEEKSP